MFIKTYFQAQKILFAATELIFRDARQHSWFSMLFLIVQITTVDSKGTYAHSIGVKH